MTGDTNEGRIAEVYRRNPAHRSGLEWIGYTADPPDNATWSTELQGWIEDDEATS